jgi:hypothetical protein
VLRREDEDELAWGRERFDISTRAARAGDRLVRSVLLLLRKNGGEGRIVDFRGRKTLGIAERRNFRNTFTTPHPTSSRIPIQSSILSPASHLNHGLPTICPSLHHDRIHHHHHSIWSHLWSGAEARSGAQAGSLYFPGLYVMSSATLTSSHFKRQLMRCLTVLLPFYREWYSRST